MVNKEHMAERLTRANPVPHPEHLHEDPAEADALLALILERRDDMTLTQQPLPTKPPTRPWWQPARIAAVAAILVVLVVGAVALIGFGGDEPDAAEQATTLPAAETTIPEAGSTVPPVTQPPPTVQPVQPATLFDGRWMHETSEQPFNQFEVVETNIGYFSRGGSRAGLDPGGGVWFSPDGSDWSQVVALPVGEVIEDARLLPGEPPIRTVEASVT